MLLLILLRDKVQPTNPQSQMPQIKAVATGTKSQSAEIILRMARSNITGKASTERTTSGYKYSTMYISEYTLQMLTQIPSISLKRHAGLCI